MPVLRAYRRDMSVIFGVLAGLSFLALLVLAGRALLAADGAGPWRAVADAVSRGDTVRIRGRTRASAARAPRSGQPCAWAATWVSEARSGVGSGAGANGVAVFERTREPLVISTGVATVTLPADAVLVQAQAGAPPFGLALADRALAQTAASDSYARWAAQGDTERRGGVTFGEVVLGPGEEVEAIGVADGAGSMGAPPGLRGVLVLRPGEAELAAARAIEAQVARQRRWRPVAIAAGLFVVAVIGAGVTA